ncbi:DNA topology modulation protein FlaR [uncultured Roseobacter sp.]|uniref:DNA topology modulation protein FlaR n=1 Tax=uncultured Roseobacter sp. TaxID=114847 RepID=UPI00261DC7F7|nr:DNA topology modulation protein FlaR [uncultured Roseobacter sp.]
MDRIIVTGANGVGKSHFAARLALVRPDIPVVSFDVIKLKKGWAQKPRAEIDAALAMEIEKPRWILEGGPSLLPRAVERAQALIWLDPPEHVRVWQLALRPWKYLGRTRPELPSGNVDWPLQQYHFALRSLRNRARFHSYIGEIFEGTKHIPKWRCRSKRDRDHVLSVWAGSAG